MEYYSAMKKTWMDLENIMVSEINQIGYDFILYTLTYMWNIYIYIYIYIYKCKTGTNLHIHRYKDLIGDCHQGEWSGVR